MSDSARSMSVLKKLMKKSSMEELQSSEKLVEEFLSPKKPNKKILRKPGRPNVDKKLKAKNFTLCLAPNYLDFLDAMVVNDKKVKGRGRKIRFIIDQFIELHKRQKRQLDYLSEALVQVEEVLRSFSQQVKKGSKLELSQKEKNEISKAVKQVQSLVKLLAFTPKELHRILPRTKWSVLSFCLDWSNKQSL